MNNSFFGKCFSWLSGWAFVLALGLSSSSVPALASSQVVTAASNIELEHELLEAKRLLVEEQAKNLKQDREQFISVGLVTFAVGVIAGIWGWTAFIRRWVNKEVDKQIQANSAILADVVQARRLEAEIKQRRKMAIIYGDQGSNNLDLVLKKEGFVHVSEPQHYDAVNLKTLHVDGEQVIFDNLEQDVLLVALEQLTTGKPYLLYRTGERYETELLKAYTVGFANSESALTPRLLELLARQ